MKAEGRNYLRVTGFLEMVFGVVSILMILWILNQDVTHVTFFGNEVAKETLWVLVYIYGTAGFKILSGLFGIIFANSTKHCNICYVLGLILILLQASSFGTIEFTVANIISYTLAMIVPVYYFYGAAKNKKQALEAK